MELDVLLEVVPEVQVILQNVTILEKRIHENPAMGHPEVSFDTFIFGTSRCCSDTSVARALQIPPEFRFLVSAKGSSLTLLVDPCALGLYD